MLNSTFDTDAALGMRRLEHQGNRMLKVAAALLAFFLALSALADELRVPLTDRDELVMDLPAGWRGQFRRPRPDLPPTISITAPNAGSFQMLVTPMWPMGSAMAPTAAELREVVSGAAEKARSQAIEPELKIMELAAPGKSGYYFSATDRQPEPGGYKYLTQGALGLNELRVTFTILVNGEPAEPTNMALELLRSMRRSTAQ